MGFGGEGIREAAKAPGSGVGGEQGGNQEAVVFVEGDEAEIEGAVVEGIQTQPIRRVGPAPGS